MVRGARHVGAGLKPALQKSRAVSNHEAAYACPPDPSRRIAQSASADCAMLLIRNLVLVNALVLVIGFIRSGSAAAGGELRTRWTPYATRRKPFHKAVAAP